MPREIRTIKRTLFTDEKLGSVSRGARLTFIGLLPNADDYGRLKGDPRLLRAAIYPLDEDVTPATVTAEIDELEGIGVVRRYVVADTTYLQIVNFDKHQVMNRLYKSDIPAPVDNGAPASAVPPQPSRSAHAVLPHGSHTVGAERSGEEKERSGVTPLVRQKAAALEGEQLFDDAWALYPKRSGGNSKPAARKKWVARLREGVPAEVMLAGVGRYRVFCEATGKVGTPYVMQTTRFLGPDRHYDEPWEIPPPESSDDDDRLAAADSMLERGRALVASRAVAAELAP